MERGDAVALCNQAMGLVMRKMGLDGQMVLGDWTEDGDGPMGLPSIHADHLFSFVGKHQTNNPETLLRELCSTTRVPFQAKYVSAPGVAMGFRIFADLASTLTPYVREAEDAALQAETNRRDRERLFHQPATPRGGFDRIDDEHGDTLGARLQEHQRRGLDTEAFEEPAAAEPDAPVVPPADLQPAPMLFYHRQPDGSEGGPITDEDLLAVGIERRAGEIGDADVFLVDGEPRLPAEAIRIFYEREKEDEAVAAEDASTDAAAEHQDTIEAAEGAAPSAIATAVTAVEIELRQKLQLAGAQVETAQGVLDALAEDASPEDRQGAEDLVAEAKKSVQDLEIELAGLIWSGAEQNPAPADAPAVQTEAEGETSPPATEAPPTPPAGAGPVEAPAPIPQPDAPAAQPFGGKGDHDGNGKTGGSKPRKKPAAKG